MTTFKNKIGLSDIKPWDGVTKAFTRPTSTGGSLSQGSIGTMVDVLSAYGDGITIAEADLLAAIGAVGTNEVCIELAPGEWPITADLTTGANLTFRLRRGATFVVSGGVTLDLSLSIIFPEEETWSSGAGTVTVDNSNVVGPGATGGDSFQFNTAAGITVGVGEMAWNDTSKTVDLGLPGDVTMQIGQEIPLYVKNESGSDVDDGDMVYVAGSTGVHLVVGLADASDLAKCSQIGMVTTPAGIANNGFGFATRFGAVRGLDADGSVAGETWNDGDLLYLSASTPGGLTKTPPGTPHFTVEVGLVVNNNGSQGVVGIDPKMPHAADTSLGTSDLTGPTQGAVKTYVDTATSSTPSGVANGSFELTTGGEPDKWTDQKTGDATDAIETTVIEHGAQSLKMTATATGGIPKRRSDDYLPISGGLETVFIAGAVRQDAADTVGGNVIFYEDDQSTVVSTVAFMAETSLPATDTWYKITGHADAPATARYYRIDITAGDGATASNTYWDGIQTSNAPFAWQWLGKVVTGAATTHQVVTVGYPKEVLIDIPSLTVLGWDGTGFSSDYATADTGGNVLVTLDPTGQYQYSISNASSQVACR